MFNNIIFDWSGTLVDDLPAVLDATNKIFTHYGRPPLTLTEFREKFCLPFTEFYARHLPEAAMTEIDRNFTDAFKLLEADTPLLPHAKELLDYCRAAGRKLFLLSSIHAEHYAAQAPRLGLATYFTKACVQVRDKREVIHALLAEFDLDPRATLFVGDMEHDIATARHGGVASCAVLTGYNTPAMLQAAAPDLLFNDLRELQEYLVRQSAPLDGRRDK
ncbi:MAG: HAD family hydrolase [Verrucomicrobiales bacterium]|jgi:phosphoglycolate phosphatase|nr:HAD family hydrolase [Verrucomicrobiales bacterium]